MHPHNLFDLAVSHAGRILLENDGRVVFYPYLFDAQENARLYAQLRTKVQWRQEHIRLYGREIPVPRLSAWYGDPGKKCIYSGLAMTPEPWFDELIEIRERIEPLAGMKFNSVLVNLYRDGKDGVAWHSDDEPELGGNPVIGSVSFGATRRMMFRYKEDKSQKVEVMLCEGSFLLMDGVTQHYWQHQIPKTTSTAYPRYVRTWACHGLKSAPQDKANRHPRKLMALLLSD